MPTQEVKRKLTAILSADVKGYSRLMGDDEVLTLNVLSSHLQLMTDLIQRHRGRVVNTAGDALLAEFASVVDAVQCAVEVQKDLKVRNADLPENRRVEFRVGINLGDVIEKEETIYGDGVNIAARVQSLAEAGGICISGTVYEHIEKKLSLSFEYLGEQAVKNIEKPVRVYRILMEPGVTKAERASKSKAKGRRTLALGFLVAFLVGAAVVALWQFYLRPSAPRMEVASKEKMAFPLPDVPSIAVLPFVNMSEDPKQEFLCDGITEEIITALSKVHNLVVISRQSTFTYKGKPVKIKQVSEELGVRYVLEGSVQRSGDRIRVTAQLIDALTGDHLWAERYERDLKDIFALQDEITMKILTAIRVKLTTGGQASSAEKYFKGKHGLDCYLKYLESTKYRQGHNIEDVRMGRRIAEEAIAMCPESPMAYVVMAQIYQLEYFVGSEESLQESIEKGKEMAEKALALDDSISDAHALLGRFYLLKREYDKAIVEGERAIALSPSSFRAYMFYAMSVAAVGRPEEAVSIFQKAIRFNPFPETGFLMNFASAFRMAGRYEEAVSTYKKSIAREPNNILAHIGLAAAYSMMGREKDARLEAAEVLRINPNFSVDNFGRRIPYKDQSQTDKYLNALRKAGLK